MSCCSILISDCFCTSPTDNSSYSSSPLSSSSNKYLVPACCFLLILLTKSANPFSSKINGSFTNDFKILKSIEYPLPNSSFSLGSEIISLTKYIQIGRASCRERVCLYV